MCAKAVVAQACCLPETGNVTTFDIGETDEKNVWFGSRKSVGFCCGNIHDSDNVRVRRSDCGRLQGRAAQNGRHVSARASAGSGGLPAHHTSPEVLSGAVRQVN